MSDDWDNPRPIVRWPWLLLLLGTAAVGVWWFMGGAGTPHRLASQLPDPLPRQLPKMSLNIILLSASILVLIPLIHLARSNETRDLLSKCLLFSLLLHVALTMSFSAVRVGQDVIQYVREEPTLEIPIDLQAARVAELQAQVRNQITDAGDGLGAGEGLLDSADPGTPGGVLDVPIDPPRPVSVQVPQSVKPAPLAIEADAPRVRPTPQAERVAQAAAQPFAPPPMEIFVPRSTPVAPTVANESPQAAPSANAPPIERPSMVTAPPPVVTSIAPVIKSDPPLAIELPIAREGPPQLESLQIQPKTEDLAAPPLELPPSAVAPVARGEVDIIAPRQPSAQRQASATTRPAAPAGTQLAVPTVGAAQGRSIAELGIGGVAQPLATPPATPPASPDPLAFDTLEPAPLPHVSLPAGPSSTAAAERQDWAVAQVVQPPRAGGRGGAGGPRVDAPGTRLGETGLDPVRRADVWAPEALPVEPPIALLPPAPATPEPIIPEASLTPLNTPLGPTTMKTDALVQRAPEVRSALVEELGGSKETEAAVARALAYLARNQEPDGRWTRFNTDAAPRRQRPTNYDIALTGLATLAFLAADHTPEKPGPYQQTVKRALDMLAREQRVDGDLRGDLGGDLYDHSIATIALAEAAAMSRNETYRRAALKGAEYLVHSRNRATGGWRYSPGEAADTSVTGWVVMALHSAGNLGYIVPQDVIRDARRWIDAASSGKTRILTAYQLDEPPSPTMTAQGVFTRILLGQKLTEAQVEEATEFITRTRPSAREPNYYHWYYVTMTLMQLRGEAWTRWNADITQHLAATQRRGGAADGSWDSDGLRNDPGGRVYATAMAALTLEVYYRYLPLYGQRQ